MHEMVEDLPCIRLLTFNFLAGGKIVLDSSYMITIAGRDPPGADGEYVTVGLTLAA